MTLKASWFVCVIFVCACGGESSDDGSGGVSGGGAGGASGSAGAAGGGAGGASATGGSGGASGGAAGSSGGAAGSSGGAAGGTAVDCNPSTVTCKSMPPQCPPGEVPTVENQCWGSCVPILSCAPVADCKSCKNGFCAAYVAFTTEYRCVLPDVQCAALACTCLSQYLCAAPYSACTDSPSGPAVSCECPTC
jgi:hypothetical protein